jgi:hypothetical protein
MGDQPRLSGGVFLNQQIHPWNEGWKLLSILAFTLLVQF